MVNLSPDGWHLYVLSRARNVNSVDSFVSSFVDRGRAEDMRDEQLRLLPPQTPGNRGFDDFQWEPAFSLTHALERGLDDPDVAFMLLHLPTSRTDLRSATIGFTVDAGIVFGLEARSKGDAIAWLRRLGRDYAGKVGMVTDYHPPYSLAEAHEYIASGRTHATWTAHRGED